MFSTVSRKSVLLSIAFDLPFLNSLLPCIAVYLSFLYEETTTKLSRSKSFYVIYIIFSISLLALLEKKIKINQNKSKRDF